MNNHLSKVLMFLVVFLAAIPFGEVYSLKLGFVILNLYEIIYLLIAFTLVLLILNMGFNQSFLVILICWLAISVLYVFISSEFYDIPIVDAVKQLRFYIPFYLAIMILVTPLSGNIKPLNQRLTVAAIVSASLALIIHHLFPSFLFYALSSDEVVTTIIDYGRLFWTNNLIVFFVISHYLCSKYGHTKTIAFVAVLLTIFTLVNTENRTSLIGVAFYSSIATYPLFKNKLKYLGTIILFSVIIISSFVILYQLDSRFATLINSRILSGGELENVYSQAVVKNRSPLYEAYWNSIVSYFPLGQGLGRPFFSGGFDAYHADISFIAFLLPFGLLGMLIFVSFIVKLWTTLSSCSYNNQYDQKFKFVLRTIFITFFFMSFNIDIFSRNNAIIYLALLVSMLRGNSIQAFAKASFASL